MMLYLAISGLDKQMWSATVEGTETAAKRINYDRLSHMWNSESAHANKAIPWRRKKYLGVLQMPSTCIPNKTAEYVE